MRRITALITALLLLLTTAVAAAQPAAAGNALTWIGGQQQADGSFAGFGVGDTADAIVAYAAAEQAIPAAALEFLAGQAGSFGSSGAGASAKLILAAVAGGADPRNFGGVDMVAQLAGFLNLDSGLWGSDIYGHSLAMLAVKAVEAEIPAPAFRALLAAQLPDGGWSYDGSAATGSDTNTTAIAMMALSGRPSAGDALTRARAYLRTQQNSDGGFPYSQTSAYGNATDANSTAVVLQAILALGEDPSGPDWTQAGGKPLTALAALQNSSGALRYSNAMVDDNALATYQAVPALLMKSLPVRSRPVAEASAVLAAGAPAAAAPAAAAATAVPATAMPATAASPTLPWLGLAVTLIVLLSLGVALRLFAVRSRG
jgi:hypothetical protein